MEASNVKCKLCNKNAINVIKAKDERMALTKADCLLLQSFKSSFCVVFCLIVRLFCTTLLFSSK